MQFNSLENSQSQCQETVFIFNFLRKYPDMVYFNLHVLISFFTGIFCIFSPQASSMLNTLILLTIKGIKRTLLKLKEDNEVIFESCHASSFFVLEWNVRSAHDEYFLILLDNRRKRILTIRNESRKSSFQSGDKLKSNNRHSSIHPKQNPI